MVNLKTKVTEQSTLNFSENEHFLPPDTPGGNIKLNLLFSFFSVESPFLRFFLVWKLWKYDKFGSSANFYLRMLSCISTESILWTDVCIFLFSCLVYFKKVVVVICKFVRCDQPEETVIPFSANPPEGQAHSKNSVGLVLKGLLDHLWGMCSHFYYLYCRYQFYEFYTTCHG